MKFEDLRKGMILWETALEGKDKIFGVLNKTERSVFLFEYEPSVKQIRRKNVSKEEWDLRQYTTLSLKMKHKTESTHNRKFIEELFEYSEVIFGKE